MHAVWQSWLRAHCPSKPLAASSRPKKSISQDNQIEYDGGHHRDRSTHITYNAALGHTGCGRHDHLVYHRLDFQGHHGTLKFWISGGRFRDLELVAGDERDRSAIDTQNP